MSFLQPLLLAALPLVGLPILIHLINRQRHRTIPWGAMRFLLDAKRMTRGMARLRFWLIMAMRMLAIAGLLFAVARPLASGWIGLAVGGQPDTTIVLLDRSVSMEQQELPGDNTKRSTALAKLADLIKTLGGGTQIVLIESTENQAQEIESAAGLMDLPQTQGTSTSADIASMMQTALDYVVENQTGRTDVWVCSDLRENDWKPDDGRWETIRSGFGQLEGIRFGLLTYSDLADDNISVRVANVRRRQDGPNAELVLDVFLRRETNVETPAKVPLEFVINGARSVLDIEMVDAEYTLQGHTIPLDRSAVDGWGSLAIPTDANLRDNICHFVFAEPPVHHTTIVADDREAAELFRLAAISPADPALQYTADVFAPDRVGEVDWDATSCLIWQAPLPDAATLSILQSFVDKGRPIMFFPSMQPGTGSAFGATWGSWAGADNQATPIASWRGDSDLLRQTRGGTPLPVGKLRVFRYCELQNGGTSLARLEGGKVLMSRASTDGGPVYFCSTLPLPGYSSLAQDGVMFYIMIQRALSAGAATQGSARQLVAGTVAAREVSSWKSVLTTDEVLPSARPFVSGAYQKDTRLVAINRPGEEDMARVVTNDELSRMMGGLDYRKVEDKVGNASALASEIWRSFVLIMALAMLVEAALCFPDRKKPVATAEQPAMAA